MRWARLGAGLMVGLVLSLTTAGCAPPAPWFVEYDLPGDTRDPTGPYRVTAVVAGPVDAVSVTWQVQTPGGLALPEGSARLRRSGDRWAGDVPGQPAGSRVDLTLTASGAGGDTATVQGVFAVLDHRGVCLVDGDCLPGEICGAGTCRVPPAVCVDDADCAQDYFCPAPGAQCRFRPALCGVDADCAPGYVCLEGLCSVRPECRVDDECASGRCIVPPGRCADPDACLDAGDCPDNRPVCRDGRCIDDAPMLSCPGGCPDGTFCQPDEQRCVPCTADGHCPGGHCDLTAWACAPGPRGAPCTPCDGMRPCGGGYGCRLDGIGICVAECGTGCPDGSVCADGICHTEDERFCSGPSCRVDGDCDSGVCLAGWCEPRQYCVRDADCAADRRCTDARCVPRAAPCRLVGECPRGQLCIGGRCAEGRPIDPCAPCQRHDDCASPAICAPFDDGERRCATLCNDDCPGDALVCLQVDDGLAICLDDQGTCPRPDCGDDLFEDNDTAATATLFPFGAVVEGRLCARDTDWFVLDALEGAGLFLQSAGTIRLTVLDGAGETLRQIDVPAGNDVELTLPRGARQVRLTTDVEAEFEWTMVLGPPPAPACDEDGFEPDGDVDDATVLGGGADVRAIACPADEDWFRIRSRGRPGRVVVQGDAVLDVRLLALDGDVIAVERAAATQQRFDRGFDAVLLVVRCAACDDGVEYRVRTTLDR